MQQVAHEDSIMTRLHTNNDIESQRIHIIAEPKDVEKPQVE